MSEPANRHSPLATVIGGATPLELDGLQIAELPFLGHLNLRLDPTNTALVNAAETAIGLELPLVPNRSTGSSTQAALWLAPDEWLLLTPQDRQVALVEDLEHSLAGAHFAVNDVSSGQTLISVTGVAARGLLARGSSIDLHPHKFVPGCCAQTLFAKATVLLCQWDDDPPAFGLIVRRSFADYLWTWLADAARDTV
jgi:sarcosine oxidase subunit gamma